MKTSIASADRANREEGQRLALEYNAVAREVAPGVRAQCRSGRTQGPPAPSDTHHAATIGKTGRIRLG